MTLISALITNTLTIYNDYQLPLVGLDHTNKFLI